MNKKELVKSVAEKTGYTQKDILLVTDCIFDTITKTIKTEDVNIVGFGKFVSVDKAARDMKNPLTGEIVHVPAKKAPKFKASTALKDAIN